MPAYSFSKLPSTFGTEAGSVLSLRAVGEDMDEVRAFSGLPGSTILLAGSNANRSRVPGPIASISRPTGSYR